jgi:hypothetical protein
MGIAQVAGEDNTRKWVFVLGHEADIDIEDFATLPVA